MKNEGLMISELNHSSHNEHLYIASEPMSRTHSSQICLFRAQEIAGEFPTPSLEAMIYSKVTLRKHL